MHKKVSVCLMAAIAMLTAQPVLAQERSATKAGFSLPPNSGKKILVFQPVVKVGAQSTAGMFEPRADWSDRAKNNILQSLSLVQGKFGNSVTLAPEVYGDDALNVEEHLALFAAIAQSVIEYQFFIGNRLPTKKRDNKSGDFEWSMGTGVQTLPGAKEADYALFIYNRDAFGSTGRKLFQIAAILAAGVPVTSGEHAGYAGLVDLKTGDLVWLNADSEMGGDVRDPDGSQKRVKQLLEDFPGSTFVKDAAE